MNRRELIERSLYGAAALSLSTSILSPVPGTAPPARAATPPGTNTVLRVVRRTIDVNGRAASVFGLVQPDGRPGITLPAATRFDVVLRNETDEPTIVHWHGLTPPWDQDGVGDAPLPPIAPRAERAFDFPVGAAGTHWMHAHTLQEQGLLAAPLIVTDPADRGRDEQEVVTLLHDFSFTPPEELLARLKGGGGHGAMGAMDHARMAHDPAAPATPRGIAPMRMDLNDIDYDAYLANDRTLDDPEVVRVERGGRVRLRIINGATATAFTIDLGDISGTLVAVDGQDIAPVAGRRFPIAMGQRLDIRLVMPSEARAVPILALREGARERTGFILAPKDAAVRKAAPTGDADGPVVGMALEQTLRPARLPAQRKADKALATTLVGDMKGYSWGLETKPGILVRRGSRVEITMTNMSMMAHPMHLHGHHFQVVAIDGKRFAGAVRDTVHITPHRSVTISVDAANPGKWAFHCHHLYHMAAGMMSAFAYET